MPGGEGFEMPVPTTRGLKRSLSAAGFDDDEDAEDANGREKEIAKERMEAWGQAQAARRKWVTASSVHADRMSGQHLDAWWVEQTAAL